MNPVNPKTKELIKKQGKYKQPTMKIYSGCLEMIMREISIETGESLMTIKRMLDNSFKLTSKVLTGGNPREDLESLQWIYFGTFRPSLKKVTKYRNYLKRKDAESE